MGIFDLEVNFCLFRRRNVHLPPDIVDHINNPLQFLHHLLKLRIDKGFIAGRIRGQHDGTFGRFFRMQKVPDFLSHKWRIRLEQQQDVVENVSGNIAGKFFVSRIGVAVKPSLNQFDIPVTVIVPDEIIENLGRGVESESLQLFVHVTDCVVQAGENPTIHQGKVVLLLKGSNIGSPAVITDIHQHESRSIPELIAEIATQLEGVQCDIGILPFRCCQNQ